MIREAISRIGEEFIPVILLDMSSELLSGLFVELFGENPICSP